MPNRLTSLILTHDRYLYFPIISSSTWAITISTLLITWLAQGRPMYPSIDGRVAYISDIGADILKPLFIIGCITTAVGYSSTIIMVQVLRRRGRLVPHQTRKGRVFGNISIFGVLLASLALSLLSILDTATYLWVHRILLDVFVFGVVLSAVFSILEFRLIHLQVPSSTFLRKAYIIKAIFAAFLVATIIVMIVMMWGRATIGAILEWVLGYGFIFFQFSYYYDLKQARGVQDGTHSHFLHQSQLNTTAGNEKLGSVNPSPEP